MGRWDSAGFCVPGTLIKLQDCKIKRLQDYNSRLTLFFFTFDL
jgi:hypothetical protein